MTKLSTYLLAGSGGREHALAWALAKSPHVERVCVAPGNPGIAAEPKCENVAIGSDEVPALAEFAAQNGVDMAVLSDSSATSLALAGALGAVGVRVVAPTQEAAQVCASRAFAKQFMREANIPTPDFAVCRDYADAHEFIRDKPFKSSGFVVKPDGRLGADLATATGAFVCDTPEQAEAAAKRLLTDHEAGATDAAVVIEERLRGRELTATAVCDGKNFRALPLTRVYRRALDEDDGPMTAGVGAVAPAPHASDALHTSMRETIFAPLLSGLAARGTPFVGVVRVGVIANRDSLNVIGIDAGFGDPEAQATLPLLASDLHEALAACLSGTLDAHEIRSRDGSCVSVVLTSAGYPHEYRIGAQIEVTGRGRWAGLQLFQSGTERDAEGRLVTSNGRVLTVSASGANLEGAITRAYEGVRRLSFDGMTYRTDIGAMR